MPCNDSEAILEPLMTDEQLRAFKAQLYVPEGRPDCLLWSSENGFRINRVTYKPVWLMMAMHDGKMCGPLIRTCGLPQCLNPKHIVRGNYVNNVLPPYTRELCRWFPAKRVARILGQDFLQILALEVAREIRLPPEKGCYISPSCYNVIRAMSADFTVCKLARLFGVLPSEIQGILET